MPSLKVLQLLLVAFEQTVRQVHNIKDSKLCCTTTKPQYVSCMFTQSSPNWNYSKLKHVLSVAEGGLRGDAAGETFFHALVNFEVLGNFASICQISGR